MDPENHTSDATPANGGTPEEVETEPNTGETAPAPTHGTSGFQKLGESQERATAAEVEAQRDSEQQAARDEHNERTGGGNYPTSDQR